MRTRGKVRRDHFERGPHGLEMAGNWSGGRSYVVHEREDGFDVYERPAGGIKRTFEERASKKAPKFARLWGRYRLKDFGGSWKRLVRILKSDIRYEKHNSAAKSAFRRLKSGRTKKARDPRGRALRATKRSPVFILAPSRSHRGYWTVRNRNGKGFRMGYRTKREAKKAVRLTFPQARFLVEKCKNVQDRTKG